jgi:hypothetical protein
MSYPPVTCAAVKPIQAPLLRVTCLHSMLHSALFCASHIPSNHLSSPPFPPHPPNASSSSAVLPAARFHAPLAMAAIARSTASSSSSLAVVTMCPKPAPPALPLPKHAPPATAAAAAECVVVRQPCSVTSARCIGVSGERTNKRRIVISQLGTTTRDTPLAWLHTVLLLLLLLLLLMWRHSTAEGLVGFSFVVV